MSKFAPTPAEVALVNQIFTQADTQKLGVITGDAAVKIFSGAKLAPTVLAEVWSLADEDNNGVLTRKGVAIAVRLLGHAQRGEKITEAMINQPGPIPTIEGLASPIFPQSTGVPTPRSPPPVSLPLLTAQDKAKFMKIFSSCGPTNGLLGGQKAKDVFVKSKLPVDKLSQIWNLADTKNRGALDDVDFIIAMYLIQASMSGQLQTLPSILPPGLYEQAGGKPTFDGVAVHATGGSASYSPSMNSFPMRPMSMIEPHFTGQGSPLHPQMTGQARQTPGGLPLPARSSVPQTSSTFPFVQPQATGSAQQWDVTPAEKANADRLFETLDTQKKGYIEGDIAVPFMLQSKLSEEVLAQVWDLADINNDGRLTRDGFAVAMHLIQAKLNGKEIPNTIPLSLIPPSMRTVIGTTPAPAQPLVTDSIRDLLWDESPPASATAPPQQQAILQPHSTGTMSTRPPQTMSPPSRMPTMPDPFAASSPFQVPAPAPHKDLLGDDEDTAHAASPPLQDQSAEIGNTKNQLNSTNKSLETAKAERESVERTLSEQAAQLSALQTQLSSAKAAYETETRLLSTLRERFANQAADIQKAREELIHGESNLSAVRVEKAEVEGALLRDKEEVRDLQRKMTEVGMQVETLKVEVEKAKKEAKQQKGLLAIAKKQLAHREADKAKVEKELEDAQQEVASITKEREESEAELAKETPTSMTNGHGEPAASPDILAIAAAQPLPATPELVPTSPTGSVMSLGKSNNPFDRVAIASGTGSRSQSPFLPFTNSAVLPTPTIAPAERPAEARTASPALSTTAANPFRLPQASSKEEAPAAPQAPSELVKQATGASEGGVLSPTDTDLFSTPPTTATVLTPSPAPQPQGEAQGKTQAIPAEPTPAPTPVPATIEVQEPAQAEGAPNAQEEKPAAEEQTDLSHQLKELDAEESDSESDYEENEPLATVKTRLSKDLTGSDANGHAGPSTHASSAPPSAVSEDPFGASFSTTESPQPASPAQPAPSIPAPSQPPAASAADFFGAPFVPSTTPSVPSTAPSAPVPVPSNAPAEAISLSNGSVAPTPGVNDFDEAMGKISASPSTSGGPSQPSQFSFDSAFDDNFDFAAANAAANQTPTVNGHGNAATATTTSSPPNAFDSVFMTQHSTSAVQPFHVNTQQPAAVASSPFGQPALPAPQQTRPFSFDDAFGSSAGDANHTSPGNVAQAISFDDAFGGRSSALALDSFSAGSQHPAVGSAQQMRAGHPFPTTTSPPLSPTGTASPQLSARRSSSPPRHASPPPRHSSPKPRPSTSLSDKVPNVRHSKLSLRLPFGRKKKSHDTPPVPPPPLPSHQIVEDPTPAVDDDIEAVKQLCGMGFSRTQAVAALEMHGYDMQRALNSLLGEQSG
ncbi:uncharacterized protein LAESUDRAFT_729113 [Laetiporus sulphureus 93-53]|uniref:EF-hand n=1 Tax=Laetiporus sulphureus 93-53 TaxID=1314785 RepID=A0A165CVT6_9APHY|nr:uncharacterized protein LAESUDRAFT_729113 [Laetiporus sulphureus 93-53]KZT03527.1 hypothetical protein LAESUDRAFT_729113 [Laetiporus sulphureus 93-53]